MAQQEAPLKEPLKLRLKTIRNVLDQLKQAKHAQDANPRNISAGRGVWISHQLWRAVCRQLQSQITEMVQWEAQLAANQQEMGSARQLVADVEHVMAMRERAAQKQIADLEGEAAAMQASMQQQLKSWAKQKEDMTQQAERLLKALHDREDVARENARLLEELRGAQAACAAADVAAREANLRAEAMQRQSDYFVDKSADGRADRAALAHQVRDLDLALSQARAELEALRQQQNARHRPSEHLIGDLRRLTADNERLVALLGQTKEWQRVARDLSTEGGVHYVPVEEALVAKGSVGSVYTPLKDRPLDLAALGTDPEEWAWVPKQAIAVTLEAVASQMPTAPLRPLLNVLLSLNKVWRHREATKLEAARRRHASELRDLHKMYRQRAPYEAVVGNTRLADRLKRQLRLQAAHAKQLAEVEAGGKREAEDDSKMLLALGLDSINTLNKQVTRLQGQKCRLGRQLSAVRKQPRTCPTCATVMLEGVPLPPPLPTHVATGTGPGADHEPFDLSTYDLGPCAPKAPYAAYTLPSSAAASPPPAWVGPAAGFVSSGGQQGAGAGAGQPGACGSACHAPAAAPALPLPPPGPPGPSEPSLAVLPAWAEQLAPREASAPQLPTAQACGSGGAGAGGGAAAGDGDLGSGVGPRPRSGPEGGAPRPRSAAAAATSIRSKVRGARAPAAAPAPAARHAGPAAARPASGQRAAVARADAGPPPPAAPAPAAQAGGRAGQGSSVQGGHGAGAHMARLVAGYEQPVLRFSLWGKDGALREGG